MTQNSKAEAAKVDEDQKSEDDPSFFEEDCDETTGIQSFYEYPTFVHQSFGIDFDDDGDDEGGSCDGEDDQDHKKEDQAKPESEERSQPNANAGGFLPSCDDENPSSSEDYVQNRQTSVTPVEKLSDEAPAPPLSQASSSGLGIDLFQCFTFF